MMIDDFFLLESSSTENHTPETGEVDQLQFIRGCFVMWTEFSGSSPKTSFFAYECTDI